MFSVRKTTEQFIADALKVHGDKYSYAHCDYKGNKVKVKILCRIHGVFEQRPNCHLSGKGCRDCSTIKVHEKQRKSLADFIKQARVVHGDLYDYSKAIYKSNKDKIEIICRHHGSFFPTPKNHLNGAICLMCSCDPKITNTKRGFNLFSNSGYEEYCNDVNKTPFIYLLKIKDKEQCFYKIGLSVCVRKRISHIKEQSKMNVDLLSKIQIDPRAARSTEIKIHRTLKPHRYYPTVSFAGDTECFSKLTNEVKDFFGV